MAILEKELKIKYSSRTLKHYESLGYIFPRVKGRILRGTEITVKTEDLTDGSNVKVTKVCDICDKKVKQSYCNVLICRKNNYEGIDRCLDCQTKEKGIKKGIADENNCIANVNPEFAKLFWNVEETYKYKERSGKKTNFKCLECGSKIENKIIVNVLRQGVSCPKCSDGRSYPEKFVFNLLDQLGLNFEYQKTFDSWTMATRKIYDFFIPSLNMIIETHGKHHYEGGFERYGTTARTLKEELQNDINKKEVALNNGIHKDKYIVINASQSKLEFLKGSILKSPIDSFLNLSSIDWEKCHEYACKSIVKDICESWSIYKNLTKVSNMFKIDRATVRRYLKQGSEIGWCNYDANDTKKSPKKVVQLTLTGDYVAEYESQKEVERQLGIKASRICVTCRGDQKSAGGYKWMYKEDYEK